MKQLNETESEVQETAKKSKKAPRPVILIYRNIDSYTIITPKSMTLLSDGQREPSDRTLAGHTWVISADCSEALFQIGDHKVSYNLPKDITNDTEVTTDDFDDTEGLTNGSTEGNDTNGANSSTEGIEVTESFVYSSTEGRES